jgi:hypothetical protein
MKYPTERRSGSVVLIVMGDGGVVHEKVSAWAGKLVPRAVVPVAEHNSVPDARYSFARGKITPQFAVFFIHSANVTVDEAGIVPPGCVNV